MFAINICMALKDEAIFKDHTDYWMVAHNIRDLYLSEGSLLTLLELLGSRLQKQYDNTMFPVKY